MCPTVRITPIHLPTIGAPSGQAPEFGMLLLFPFATNHPATGELFSPEPHHQCEAEFCPNEHRRLSPLRPDGTGSDGRNCGSFIFFRSQDRKRTKESILLRGLLPES